MWRLVTSGGEFGESVLMGDESPVVVLDVWGDIGSTSGSSGKGTTFGDGEGEEEDGGVMSGTSPFLRACKLPVDRFIVNGREAGVGELSSSIGIPEGDRAPLALGVTLPSASSRSSMTFEKESQLPRDFPLQLLLLSCAGGETVAG